MVCSCRLTPFSLLLAYHKIRYVPASRLETAHAENWVDRPCTLFSMRGDTIYMRVHPLPPAPAAPAAYGDDLTLEDDDIVVLWRP